VRWTEQQLDPAPKTNSSHFLGHTVLAYCSYLSAFKECFPHAVKQNMFLLV